MGIGLGEAKVCLQHLLRVPATLLTIPSPQSTNYEFVLWGDGISTIIWGARQDDIMTRESWKLYCCWLRMLLRGEKATITFPVNIRRQGKSSFAMRPTMARQSTSDCIRRFNVVVIVVLLILIPISAWTGVNRHGSECARPRSHDDGAPLSSTIFHPPSDRPLRDLATSALAPAPAPRTRRSANDPLQRPRDHRPHPPLPRPLLLPPAAVVVVGCAVRDHRRRGLLRIARSSVIAPLLAVQATTRSPRPALAYTPDADPLRESLYLMSRVQEATVQQERFVERSARQEELKSKMKLTLRLVEKNYRVLDQVTYASEFVVPPSGVVEATTAGYEAADALQNAIDYVNTDGVGGLGTGPFEVGQKEYLRRNLRECRERLFDFLSYMPPDKLEGARKRVEEGACAWS